MFLDRLSRQLSTLLFLSSISSFKKVRMYTSLKNCFFILKVNIKPIPKLTALQIIRIISVIFLASTAIRPSFNIACCNTFAISLIMNYLWLFSDCKQNMFQQRFEAISVSLMETLLFQTLQRNYARFLRVEVIQPSIIRKEVAY